MREPKKRCQWTFQEDELLREAVKRCGPKRWNIIATFVPNHSGKQCRERWITHLRPEVNKAPFTFEEDTKLIDLVQRMGTSWATMKPHFSNRSPCALKNRYLTLVRHDKAPKPTVWQTDISISHRNEASLFQSRDAISSVTKSDDDEYTQNMTEIPLTSSSSGAQNDTTQPKSPNDASNPPPSNANGTRNRISMSPLSKTSSETNTTGNRLQLFPTSSTTTTIGLNSSLSLGSFTAALDLLQLNRARMQQMQQQHQQQQQQQQQSGAQRISAASAATITTIATTPPHPNHNPGRNIPPNQLLSFLFSSSSNSSSPPPPTASRAPHPSSSLPRASPPSPHIAIAEPPPLFAEPVNSSAVSLVTPVTAAVVVSNPSVATPTNSITPSPQAQVTTYVVPPSPFSLNPSVVASTCSIAPFSSTDRNINNNNKFSQSNHSSGSEKLPGLREMLGAAFV